MSKTMDFLTGSPPVYVAKDEVDAKIRCNKNMVT
jgi:hypothetical protein